MTKKFIRYFFQIKKLLGFWGAARLSFYYLIYRSRLIKPKVYCIPIGRFKFHFTSLEQFAGLFVEIFLKELYLLEKTTQPIKVVDCGANVGLVLVYVKVVAPNARVICFEPNPAARLLLQMNVKENYWEGEVKIYPYALGKSNGAASFTVNNEVPTNIGGSLSGYWINRSARPRSFPVEIVRLSDYIIDDVFFLKIDIEGAEFEVLQDLAANNKFKFISNIQLEYPYHPKFAGRPLVEIVSILDSAGFRTVSCPFVQPRLLVGKNIMHTCMVYAWRK